MIDVIFDARNRRDEIEIELSLEPLLHDLHMQQPEEAATEPEPQRRRGLGFIVERRVVELQFF